MTANVVFNLITFSGILRFIETVFGYTLYYYSKGVYLRSVSKVQFVCLVVS